MPSSHKENESQLEEDEVSASIEAEFLVEPEQTKDLSDGGAGSAGDETRPEQSETTDLVPTTTLSRYLVEVRRYPFLSKEEELALFHEYRVTGSRDAAVKLSLSNLRVSIAIAREYAHTGVDQMDLIQEGNVGLMQGHEKIRRVPQRPLLRICRLVGQGLYPPVPVTVASTRENRHDPGTAKTLL